MIAVPFLSVEKKWHVMEGAPVGTPVSTALVYDLAQNGYILDLVDPTKLLQINKKTGRITLAKSPTAEKV